MAPSGGSALDPRAARLAHDADLAGVWREVHRRLEAAGGSIDGASVTVRNLAADERRALDLLLGSRRRAAEPRISLAELDAVLRTRAGGDLLVVVAEAVGPVRDLPGARAAASDRSQRAWRAVDAHPAIARHPALVDWLDRLRRTGRVAKLGADGHAELIRALDVLARLPSAPPISRPALAASALGDAHALDDSRPVGRLVLSALPLIVGGVGVVDSRGVGGVDSGPTSSPSAAERRRRWISVGVLPDEVSSTALTLGLQPVTVGPVTDAARRWAVSGLPLPVPLAAFIVERWTVEVDTVFVCENPSVLSMAAASLPQPPPMVCVEGNPSLAVQELLGQLREGGTRLRYHGDFGAGGLAIGNVVVGRLGAEPWRFGTADHAEALARLGERASVLRPLKGRVPDASWDPGLADSVRACGVEVEEEQVLDLLLADLAYAP